MKKTDLAFIFPGQGSQKIGMLAELAGQHPLIGATFEEASAVLGYDLWDLSQNGQQEDINLTERTQPLLLTASVALWRVWEARGGAVPALMAGHSLGEWSALVCNGTVAFADAVKLVRMRGAFMQEAVPAGEGAMAAVMGLDDQVIRDICAESAQGGVVSAVNYNSPGQVVIAGDAAAVGRAVEALKAAGAKRALPLPVSAPFHTSLMKPAGDRLAAHIRATPFNAPAIPVVHNVHARVEHDPEVIKERMIEQIHNPVLWVDCIKAMVDMGITTLVECGAGKVVSGLAKRIDKNLAVYATEDSASLEEALSSTK
ncbi:MAG: ACP S-malonyltransferase [Porticoccaceae bacterium]|jgi:[acyl-carrier-protein] S-malonyltransferase|nr:ACP S-malonyltransferase [Porticoccaceae bacterium]MEA3301281.1 ACP S-malonyltransferase [Pseudomonadota bacterium]HLS98952.1 ACP S-malonyltransferase [Porticoccaceae bacterium]